MAGFGLSVLSKSSKNIGYALVGYVRKTYRAGVGRGIQDTGRSYTSAVNGSEYFWV
jgi:hypothetical protein